MSFAKLRPSTQTFQSISVPQFQIRMLDKQPNTTKYFRNTFRIDTKCVPICSLLLFLSRAPPPTNTQTMWKNVQQKNWKTKLSQNVDKKTKSLKRVRKKLDNLFWNSNIQTTGFWKRSKSRGNYQISDTLKFPKQMTWLPKLKYPMEFPAP